MKTIIKGTNNKIIITPKPLKSFSFSLAAEINTPMRVSDAQIRTIT